MKRLTMKDRKRISELWDGGKSKVEIAADLGVCVATVYGELERGRTGKTDHNCREEYDPVLGQTVYNARMKNCGRRPVAAGKQNMEV